MKKILITLQVLLIVMGIHYQIYAQGEEDTTRVYRIQTIDGNEYVGTKLEETDEFIRLITDELGEINIKRQNIKEIQDISKAGLVEGKFWFENPQATRYFFSPNGYGLKKGEGYYQNVWVMFNQVAYGITENFSFGGGLIPLFLFEGSPTPVWITPKFSIPVSEDKFNIGAGVLAGTVLGESGTDFGILYGITTFGNRDGNFSIGLGYGYSGGDWADRPTVNFSGFARVGPNGYFMWETYYLGSAGENVFILCAGGRTIIKRPAIDYGLVLPIVEGGSLIAFPWLGITIPF